ncbi:SLBB domain-containing protein [Rheinheimera sp.]|uniref:SLBB domain-containing protein n=1 Tax=Rheinheimera sp. TaxID=1869214 RepID=UPI0027332497|nr:SLBB domain-containing protein [Rheinheimera sp.]MDP2715668.1 SLBB domain-containing protein [Rheinheimera sp.]
MLKFVKRLLLTLTVSMAALAPLAAVAQAISPAMLEQFKSLPRAEQERLAKQYGYTLPRSSGSGSSSADAGATEAEQDKLEPLVPPEQTDEVRFNAEEPTKPNRFGLAMFSSNSSNFSQLSNTPVPADYKLGAADSLLLQLYGKESTDYELVIANDGSLAIPDIGPLQLAGLTFDKAANLIRERVKAAKIGVDAAVSMGKLRTINVIIAGEAKRPGIYTVSALTTVTQALFIAGGVSDIGSLRDISVNRAGKNAARFDLYQLLLKGDASGDINLRHGDVVFVAPVTAMAEVKGEVQRPAIYELATGETLLSLLQMAGGAKAGAYPKSAVLERFNQQNLRDLQNLDLTQPTAQQLEVRNGDVLTVAATSPRIENVITVAGVVVRPGQYAWHAGIKVSDILPSIWSALHLAADLEYAIIVRETSNSGNIEVIQFNLADAITSPDSAANHRLAPRDMLIVFPHGDNSYQRELLYTELKKKTEISVFDEQATALKETIFGFVTPEQEKQIGYHLQQTVDNAYINKELLPLTVHFSREELLKPIIQQLEQQARYNKQPQVATVSGNVKVPGIYPLAANATVSSLINAAGGLAQSAFASHAELTRAEPDSSGNVQTRHLAINLNEVFSNNNDMLLQSRDNLNVFETPDWNVERTITLKGEVRFPGVYSIQQNESLNDIITRAGGLTEQAFVKGVVYTRLGVQEQEAEQQKKLIEQLRADIAGRALSAQGSPTAPADVITMIKELEKQKPVGRLVIDLEAIISGNPLHHIQVQNGDELLIPRRNNTISILGEVQHASSHRFDAKLSLDDYLKLAGGMRKRADDERVYVIRADGSVMVPESKWFAVSKSSLQPGDTIIVPLDTEYKDNITLWAQITQIFYQSAVTIAALNAI